MRRAISKKKQAVIVAERKTFVYGDAERGIPGAVKNGVREEDAQTLYDEILDFANYAFNKAHAVCYAKVAYDTAYLKCHFPKEYMAALMTSVQDSAGKIASYLAACKELGIALLPPDINESEHNFTPVEKGIRFGLAAVRNVGRGLVRQVVQEREQGGPFRSLEDLCERTASMDLNKRAMDSLIKCGALDCFGLRRSQLLQIYEMVMDAVAERRRQNVDGQIGLFDLGEAQHAPDIAVPNIPELSRGDLMAMEKETTGLYLSGHPMDDYRPLLQGRNIASLGEILGSLSEEDGRFRDEQTVSVAGIVQKVRQKTTRSNTVMAYVTVEDDTGVMECMAFSQTLRQYGSLLREGTAVILQGRISVREEKEPQLILNGVQLLQTDAPDAPAGAPPQKSGTLYLKLPSEEGTVCRKVRAILSMFPGKTKTVLYFAATGVRRGAACEVQSVMVEELRRLLGDENVVQK